MNKSSISPLIAWVVSALFLLIGIWQISTNAFWQGVALVALALIWAVVALRQSRKAKV